MSLVPALGRRARGSELEASLVYNVSSRTAKATQRNPVTKQNKYTEKYKKIGSKKQGDRKRKKREMLDTVHYLKNKQKKGP